MTSLDNFDDIRILNDEEVAGALKQLSHDPTAQRGLGLYWFGRIAKWRIVQKLVGFGARIWFLNVRSREDFFAKLHPILKRNVVDKPIEKLTISGLDSKVLSRPRLFISNHRDIALDSMLLNMHLFQSKRPCAKVAIGDNLQALPKWGVMLMRLAGCFYVPRAESSPRKLYEKLRHLSTYIRKLIEDGQNVWLAQREGRALDGEDTTEQAVLKMLHLQDRKNSFSQALSRLNLIPSAISYEYDPCDVYKAKRLAGEFRESYAQEVQDGLMGDKGRVHIAVGQPLCVADDASPADLAGAIDQQIVNIYRIWPTNEAAARMLGHKKDLQTGEWSDGELQNAEANLCERTRDLTEKSRNLLLNAYAKPLLRRAELADNLSESA